MRDGELDVVLKRIGRFEWTLERYKAARQTQRQILMLTDEISAKKHQAR